MTICTTESFTRLAPHAHLARLGADLVLLDEDADAYGCWIGAAEGLSFEGRRIDAAHPALLEGLAALGCLTADRRTPMQSPRTAPPPERDDLTIAAPPATSLDRLHFALTALDMLAVYPGAGLSRLLRTARRRPSGLHGQSAAVLSRSAEFRQWLPWVPLQGRCLYRALFLLLFLRRGGLDADWVFGVRTWPFAAHCWLQSGEIVLSDDLDRVRAYTPILVV